MERIDAKGQALSLALFIEAYRAARKLVPARFLVLRISPGMFEHLKRECEAVTEVVQIGEQVGHLGKVVTRIACVKPASGLGDGVSVNQDKECGPSRMEFLVHGAVEIEVVNLDFVQTGTGFNTETGQHGKLPIQ